MKKGDFVRVKEGQVSFTGRPASLAGIRSTTADENDAWYKQHCEDVKAGRDVWHDSAGESQLPPTGTRVEFNNDNVLQVLRARCAPAIGYHQYKGMVRVFDSETCEVFYLRRDDVEVVVER